MGKEKKLGKMAPNLKVFMKKERNQGKENMNGKMEANTREIFIKM